MTSKEISNGIQDINNCKEQIIEKISNTSNEDLLKCVYALIQIDDEWTLNQMIKFLHNIQK